MSLGIGLLESSQLIQAMDCLPTELHLEIAEFLHTDDALQLAACSKYFHRSLHKKAHTNRTRLLMIFFNITCNQSSIQDLNAWCSRAFHDNFLMDVPRNVAKYPIRWMIMTAFATATAMCSIAERTVPITPASGYNSKQMSCFIPHAFHFMLPSNTTSNTSRHRTGLRTCIRRGLLIIEATIAEIEQTLYRKYQHLEEDGSNIRPVIQYSHAFESVDAKSRFSVHFNTLLLKKLIGVDLIEDGCPMEIGEPDITQLAITSVCLNCSTPAHVPSAFYHGFSGLEYHLLHNITTNTYVMSQRCGQAIVTNLSTEKSPVFVTAKRPMSNAHFIVDGASSQGIDMKTFFTNYLKTAKSNRHFCCMLFPGESTNQFIDEIQWFFDQQGYL